MKQTEHRTYELAAKEGFYIDWLIPNLNKGKVWKI